MYALAGLAGMAIGGVAGLATGNNYSSAAALRNFTTGAAAGAGIGLGARAAISAGPGIVGGTLGISQMIGAYKHKRPIGQAFMSSPLGQVMRTGAGISGAALKTGAFLARHPVGTISAGILGAGAYSMYNTGYSTRSFQDSTTNLVFGLHQNRHRGN